MHLFKITRSVATVALLLSFAKQSPADLMIKEVRHTDEYKIMGKKQPAQSDTVTLWISDDKIRSSSSQDDILVRLDQNKIYLLSNSKKRFTEIPADIFQESASSPAQQLPPGMPEMFKNMITMNVTVTPTDQISKINNWSCRKYIQTIENSMMKTQSELWATEEIKISPELSAKYMTAFLGRDGSMKSMMGNLLTEMKKIKGFIVQTTTESTVMKTAIKTTNTVIEADDKASVPPETFEIPKGYKKQKWEE